MLLSFGEVQSRAGSGQEAKRALQRAATLAGQAGRSDQLARAALAYGGRFAWARASTDPALVPLLERALAAVGEQDSRTRVMLLARLAAAWRDDPGRERRVRLAEQAVEIARRIGDPVTLAAALEGQWIAVEGPEALSRGDGIAQGERLIALGEQIGDKERVFAGHDYRLQYFWMLGDRAGVEVELEALGVLADELRQPAQRWHLGAARTVLALMEGQFERAERLISETLALGQRGAELERGCQRAPGAVRAAPRPGAARGARGQDRALDARVPGAAAVSLRAGTSLRASSGARGMPARPSTACCHGTSARSTSTPSGSSA